ncbi:MAG: FAD-dependent oxidoreductase [Gemmatimonadota bacterium]
MTLGGVGPVVVVGAGVVGLTSAIRLRQHGIGVRIVAREVPPRTTSDVAAAIWYPYLAYPPERVLPWSEATRRTLDAIEDPAAGVSTVRLLELFDGPAPEPWWREALPDFGWADGAELPEGYEAAYDVRVPLVDTSVHMRWLMGRAAALGVAVSRAAVADLDDLFGAAALVVNCAGVDAGPLAGDASVTPIRGQVVRLAPVNGVRTALVDEAGPLGLTYIIPRPRDIVVGGTADAGAWNAEPDPAVASAILARACVLEPRLAGARVLGHAVGLRPGRPTVRLELERRLSGPVIHNYGHGGSGFTLAWGCADDVTALAADVLGAPAEPAD